MSKKRTIEVTEEQYVWLTSLAAVMKSQDNKRTAFPLYCIFDKEEDDTIKFINCFLTAQEMNKHLDDYKDDLKNPFTHVRSAAYNRELNILMKILVSLDDLVLPEHDNGAYE